jgi:hypothetical protein
VITKSVVISLEDLVNPLSLLRLKAIQGEEEDRLKLVLNPVVPLELFQKLRFDGDDTVQKCAVARNPSTPKESLELFAKSHNPNIRRAVALNTAASSLLNDLAKDADESVLRAVAINPSTPIELLTLLLKNDLVRLTVGLNTSTPVEVLRELARDEDEKVRLGVALNTSAPAQVLKELAQDENEVVRFGVTSNTSAPAEVLEELAQDENEVVRSGVASNTSAPAQVLKDLAQDGGSVGI